MSISNRQISKIFRLAAALLEVHDENRFKILSYEKAAQQIRTLPASINGMDKKELEEIPSIGANISKKIIQIVESGTFDELSNLMELTPLGVVEMMQIKGLGGKKVHALWKGLGIISPEELRVACEVGKAASVKGFGKKTQENILEILEFYYQSKNKFLYADAASDAEALVKYLQDHSAIEKVALTGEIRRKCEIIDKIDVLAILKPKKEKTDLPDARELFLILENDEFKTPSFEVPVNFHLTNEKEWTEQLFLTTGNEEHIQLLNKSSFKNAEDENAIYNLNDLPYIIPEMREGLQEIDVALKINTEDIIEYQMLKGCLHNHSTWSDGVNSIKEMANKCKELGLEYFGIADHSQIAFYANGLKPDDVIKQWAEIDKLNETFTDFKIFKGTEADILTDGALDYNAELLSGFDYVVGSVHSKLKMDKEEATKRLIKAIESPYITILGHMTARLLLMRKGFEVDYKKVIDACAINGVSIEINANPRRLDMDWRHLYYAIDKGIMISINPDAHDINEVENMYYGVCVARKAGLLRSQVLNTLSLEDIKVYFNKKKSSRS